MRIIAGKFKGRRFSPPSNNWPTRPTTDFAREALFNILTHEMDFDGMHALDLFGGMGGHSFEMISRGFEKVHVIEKHPGCSAFIEKTAKSLKIDGQISVVRGDVFSFLKNTALRFDYIFADPPYALPTLDILPDLIFDKGIIKGNGYFVLEHGNQHTFTLHPKFVKEKEYGSAIFSFFENGEDE